MFKFTSMSGFLALQVVTHCLLSSPLSSATVVSGTSWTGFDDFSPADESSASPMPVKGQCALGCQHHAGCQGFFCNDVSKMCVRVEAESDILSGPSVAGFHYYTNKYTCPVTTTTNLIHAASSSCFTVHDTDVSWDAARDSCNVTGGQLAVLDTQGKVNFIMNVMENHTAYTRERYHLGASRPMDSWNTAWPDSAVPDFVWLNGQPLNVTVADGYWWFNDPNNDGGKENVIQLYYQPGYAGSWIDGKANMPVGHICRYSLV